MAVIEHRPRSATATAVQDTYVYFLPRGEMLSLIERSPALAFGLLQQISHRLREFNQLHLREIVQAERLAVIGNFARSIVHDLKNPLSIIGLSAETFGPARYQPGSARPGPGPHPQAGRTHQRHGRRHSHFHRRQTRTDVEIKPRHYHAFVLELIADLRAEAELKDVRIEMQNEPPASSSSSIRAASAAFSHNLIHNATDMMPNGGTIFLRFHCDAKEIVTEIEDTGPGIAPEIADTLFEAFATFGKAHGTGLGLSICKKIVEDHGGRIWVRNEPGRGAMFAFRPAFSSGKRSVLKLDRVRLCPKCVCRQPGHKPKDFSAASARLTTVFGNRPSQKIPAMQAQMETFAGAERVIGDRSAGSLLQ